MSTTNQHITHLRTEFTKGGLDKGDVKANPFEQFVLWMEEAIKAEIKEVQAMHVATVNEIGQPSARIVYLRAYFDNQFVFYTNFESRKGIDVLGNNKVSITFFWQELERQIRIEGTIKKYNDIKSDDYFNARPEGSQIGAWASPQSQVIEDRAELDENVKDIQDKFKNEKITRPPFWGGYVIEANYYEFWQGRSSRLHDRIIYEKNNRKGWNINRIAP
jgi:pyridoxamine 5'-phosphate oxidase